MLRALGYGDGATPQNAVARAVEVGLIHEGMYTLNLPFWRADMVRVSYLAMTTIENTTKKPLFEVLIDRGAVDAEKARTLFQPLPQKLYSITGLRNHRLNIEASISGDNTVISGTYAMDDLVSIVILIQETPDTDTYWYKQTVLYDEIVWPDNSFRLYAPIPNP